MIAGMGSIKKGDFFVIVGGAADLRYEFFELPSYLLPEDPPRREDDPGAESFRRSVPS
eukprot:CAMPEP_0170510012 /NCGR_PEP_ID=MMETSP0208-20121228/65530_1 /TAXON_ID=197538 /ORGANISM="Strombidium inclinatum, Strain S3" /LENGTH=57 /DNA_ID=CAMNT_0010793429 /DNA_START=837 /DNA_END=1010 /DNA_ORIENTATION=+